MLPSTPLYAALMTLLRAGLWEKEPDDLSLFPLSDKDWTELFRMARWQAVTGIVYLGVCRLPEGMWPPEKVMLQWTVAIDRIERRNRKVNEVLTELYGEWQDYETPLVQKGQGVALFYEHPLWRECGDIDLYFSVGKHAEETVAMMNTRGVSVKKSPDGSVFYRWKGVEVEHHTRLVDIYNPFVRSYLKRLETAEGREVYCLPEQGGKIEVPSPALNLLLINAHILKHALGRGIGLRQLCDMARACYCLHAKVTAGTMERIARRTGMRKWNRLLHAFLVEHLGLPADCLPYPARSVTSRPLWSIVWKGGNFGMYPEGKRLLSGNRWTNKVNTLRSFLKNVCFSCSYAPKEAFWLMMNLLGGQLKK